MLKSNTLWLRAVIVTIVCAIGFVVFVDHPAAAAPATGSISGSVRGPANSTAGLESVGVTAYDSNGHYASDGVVTGGNYAVRNLAAGTYTLDFVDLSDAPSFVPLTTSAITVSLGQAVSGPSITLAVGGTISGRATFLGGAPGRDSQINVLAYRGMDVVGTGRADKNGNYAITGLDAYSSYRVQFVDENGFFAPIWSSGMRTMGTALGISVALGVTTPNVNTVLVEGGYIAGTVTGPAGAGLVTGRDIYAYAYDATGGADQPAVANAQVNGSGEYLIAGLVAGQYKVHFVDVGRVYSPIWSNAKASYATANAVQVTEAATTSAIDAKLQFGGSLAGRAFGGPGRAPLAAGTDILVSAFDAEDQLSGSATVAGDGSYRVDNLAPGAFRLRFTDRSGQYLTQFSYGKASLSEAQSIIVGFESTATAGDVTMGSSSASGRVTGPNGTTPDERSELLAQAIDASGAVAANANVDDAGYYRFNGLPAGAYRISIIDTRGYYLNASNAGTVTVAAGQSPNLVTSLTIALAPATPGRPAASAGVGSATISWPAVAGSAVTYTVVGSNGGTCTTAATSCTITGLIGGVSQTFTVSAANTYGASPFSAASDAVVPGVPQEAVPAPPAPAVVAVVKQTPGVKGKIVKTLGLKKSGALPATSTSGAKIVWKSSTPKICKIKKGKLVSTGKKGTCSVTAAAAANASWNELRAVYAIKVK